MSFPSEDAITVNGPAQEQQLTAPAALAPGAEAHIALAIDAEARRGVLYINGQPAAKNSAMTLTPAILGRTGNNWLGRSQYPADPHFNGRISEFRVYRRALTPEEVRRSYDAGPDRLPCKHAWRRAGSQKSVTAMPLPCVEDPTLRLGVSISAFPPPALGWAYNKCSSRRVG